MSMMRIPVFIGLMLVLVGFNVVSGYTDVEENEVGDFDDDETSSTNEDEINASSGDDITESDDDDDDDDDVTAKQGQSKSKKKIFVPVFVPNEAKKKMKILTVDKGYYIQGGTQLFGKFIDLKHCIKACADDPTCFQGDFNPWLSKCYKHTNYTACGTLKSHPQFVHFSKVPCTVTDAPTGKVTLGVSVANGIEEKGVDSLQQCIKKCVNAGRGIPLSVNSVGAQYIFQACFAIDYDFATHKCFVFAANIVEFNSSLLKMVPIHCSPSIKAAAPQGSVANPTAVHISFCPKVNFGG